MFAPRIRDGHQRDLIEHSPDPHPDRSGQWERPEQSRDFSRARDAGIWHNLDLGGHDVAHDWPWWRKMLDHYVGHRLGW